MGERRPFLLRVDPEVLAALERWSRDDLRSLNGQIEFLLRRLLQESGRLKGGEGTPAPPPRETRRK
ncbi:MAG TPA: hypothetical protein VFQ07_03125 [Candidatus Polarisedimenticolia bacterium]|nr:hypothetical protein [Candidatus Polarisedimenticolia bacterium]